MKVFVSGIAEVIEVDFEQESGILLSEVGQAKKLKDVRSFVLGGMAEYIVDYVRYEVDKRDEEGGNLEGIEVGKETWVDPERIYDLFIKFIVAWSGRLDGVSFRKIQCY
jgi:hypothetical protein